MTYVVFTLFRCLRFPTTKTSISSRMYIEINIHIANISYLEINPNDPFLSDVKWIKRIIHIHYSFRYKKIITIHICHSSLLGHPWFLLILIDLILIYTLLRYGCLLYCLLLKVCAFCLNIINGFSNYARPRKSLKKGTFFEWIMLHNRK